MTLRANQLAGLTDAIAEVHSLREPADATLKRFFRGRPSMGQQDRALIAEGVYAYLRRRRSLTAVAESEAPRRLALITATRGLGLSIREVEPAVSKNELTWLLQTKKTAPSLSDAERFDLPDWLWNKLGDIYSDEERIALSQAWLSPAPLDLRINPAAGKRDDLATALESTGIHVSPTPYSPLGLRAQGKPPLRKHPLWVSGAVEVQDEGSQLIGFLVAPKRQDMVVDFCAGAGGKTLLLGALMRSQGRLYAFDTSSARLKNLTPRLARSGLSNVHPQVISHERDPKIKRLAGKIDRVLVDAPCTGFGTLRRNPDLKWRQTPQAIDELTQKQARILDSASSLVKSGGRLVYATCSVLPSENEAIVENFLACHPEFQPGDAAAELARAKIPLDTGPMLRLSPHLHGCDGFFAAILERRR